MNTMTKKQKNLLFRILAAAAMMMALAALQSDIFSQAQNVLGQQNAVPLQDTLHLQFLQSWPMLLRLSLYLVPYFTVGHDILRKAWKGIQNRQVFDENFLMAAATVGAMALGEYAEGVAVMLFYQIGELFQSYAVGKSRRNISSLMDIRPDYANLVVEEETVAAGKQTQTATEPSGGSAWQEEDAKKQPTAAAARDEAARKQAVGSPENAGRQERIEKTDPDEVEVGSIILIQPGERVPIDGIVVEGSSALDTSALTGESIPRDVRKGQEILSGSINLSGVLRVRTTKEFEESTASRILDLVENAGSRKAKSEQFITKFARWYTPAVCYGALALAILGPAVSVLFFHAPWSRPLWGNWIYRALTFLVISCPCAIVVSIPLTFFGGIGGAGSKGILIKGSNFMETLANVRTVAFDKTGTLTKGNFAVTKICPVQADQINKANPENQTDQATRVKQINSSGQADWIKFAEQTNQNNRPAQADLEEQADKKESAQQRLLKLASLAEIYSTHPISKSLKEAYRQPLVSVRIGKSKEISGKGVITMLDGQRVAVGSWQLMQDQGVLAPKEEESSGSLNPRGLYTPQAAGTIVHVAVDGQYYGYIVIADELKPGAKEAVRALKEAGVSRTVMLTGDAESIAGRVAGELGIDEYHAGLLPDDKVRRVEELLSRSEKQGKTGKTVKASSLAFVGDGINDAPVLSRADIGIAMGALGSDAAIEAADVVLMDDDPGKIAQAIRIARKCIRIVNENICFAIGVKLLCLLLGALGIANMWLAIFADVGVMVLCVLNAVRALV